MRYIALKHPSRSITDFHPIIDYTSASMHPIVSFEPIDKTDWVNDMPAGLSDPDNPNRGEFSHAYASGRLPKHLERSRFLFVQARIRRGAEIHVCTVTVRIFSALWELSLALSKSRSRQATKGVSDYQTGPLYAQRPSDRTNPFRRIELQTDDGEMLDALRDDVEDILADIWDSCEYEALKAKKKGGQAKETEQSMGKKIRKAVNKVELLALLNMRDIYNGWS